MLTLVLVLVLVISGARVGYVGCWMMDVGVGDVCYVGDDGRWMMTVG